VSGAPLFELDGARIDAGAFTSGPLSASGGTRLVALVGYASPFFRLLRGEARLVAGAVRLAGSDAAAGVRAGAVAVSSHALPPLRESVRRFLVAGALLALVPRREAERRVAAALERFRLQAAAELALRDVPDGVRRVVSLARASLGDASVVVAEATFAELDQRAYADVLAAFESIASERRIVVSFPAEPEPDRGASVLERADFTLRLAAGSARVSQNSYVTDQSALAPGPTSV
jgi:ABC-type transport system involved in cytochrome c biogenesis ATPase subunit